MRLQVFTGQPEVSGDRLGVENVLLVLTDGQSTVNSSDTIPAAEALRASGVRIISVGTSQNVSVRISTNYQTH